MPDVRPSCRPLLPRRPPVRPPSTGRHGGSLPAPPSGPAGAVLALFDDASGAFLDSITRTVRLVRSKEVGVFSCRGPRRTCRPRSSPSSATVSQALDRAVGESPLYERYARVVDRGSAYERPVGGRGRWGRTRRAKRPANGVRGSSRPWWSRSSAVGSSRRRPGRWGCGSGGRSRGHCSGRHRVQGGVRAGFRGGGGIS